MNTKKKILMALALVGCAVLLVVGSVAVTMAYLTSQTETITNTFTVGNVKITMDEADVDEYGAAIDDADRVMENEYKLIPGHNYVKDPTIHVDANSEDCWLFVKVENEISAIEGGKTIAQQMTEKGWALVAGETNVYAYNSKVTAGANIAVFDAFTVSGAADVSTYATKTIKVTAYAIQADGFQTAAAAWAAAPSTFASTTP